MMTDKQLAILYTLVLVLWIGSFAVLHHLAAPPISAQQHADQVCQESYGPQTGAHWVSDQLMCITVRGEVLPLKRT
jgi:hypothetical protein